MIGYAFTVLLVIGFGQVKPSETVWMPTREACEAARQGAESEGVNTTDCRREERVSHGG